MLNIECNRTYSKQTSINFQIFEFYVINEL